MGGQLGGKVEKWSFNRGSGVLVLVGAVTSETTKLGLAMSSVHDGSRRREYCTDSSIQSTAITHGLGHTLLLYVRFKLVRRQAAIKCAIWNCHPPRVDHQRFTWSYRLIGHHP